MVKRMLEYLYTLDYGVESIDGCLSQMSAGGVGGNAPETGPNSNPLPPAAPQDSLVFHIHMYLLADRLLIAGLKSLAGKKLSEKLRQRLDQGSFCQAVAEIYKLAPQHDPYLRSLVVQITLDRLTELRKGNGAGSAILPNSLLVEVPKFACDLSVNMMNKCVSEWEKNEPCYKNWTKNVPAAANTNTPNKGGNAARKSMTNAPTQRGQFGRQ